MRIPKRQEELDKLARKYLTEPKPKENGQRHDPHTDLLSDEEILTRCRKAKYASSPSTHKMRTSSTGYSLGLPCTGQISGASGPTTGGAR
jgi:hypothetical protein